MSVEIITPAYKTKLGNPTAKHVLALLANEVNQAGFGWPSIKYICDRTEVSRRTVLRIVQVFVEIGLLARAVSPHGGFAVQMDLSKLGTDLADAFAKAYLHAQRKSGEGAEEVCLTDTEECRRDTPESVAETPESVAETRESVAETQPPHPLIGRPIIDPVSSLSGQEPEEEEDEEVSGELSAKELEHLESLADRPEDQKAWRYDYEQNAKERAAKARKVKAEAERLAALRRELPNLRAAHRYVMKGCGFADIEKNRATGEAIDAVLLMQEQQDVPVWVTAPAMVAAYLDQQAQGERLTAKYGPERFFGLGIWAKRSGWHWNTTLLERERGASVGSSG